MVWGVAPQQILKKLAFRRGSINSGIVICVQYEASRTCKPSNGEEAVTANTLYGAVPSKSTKYALHVT